MRDPKKKCFAKKCENCNWYRDREFEKLENGKPSGVYGIRKCCEFETLIGAMHYHMGSLDGLQSGVNEARNRSIETKSRVEDFGSAISAMMNGIEKGLHKLSGNNKKLLE
jgi:hypothetical protein